MSWITARALDYSALEKLRPMVPVNRLSCLASLCKEKRVLDLGALDETAYLSKANRGNWLHKRLTESALSVVGVDNSSLVPEEGLKSAENGVIINRDIFNLKQVISERGAPDIVVAGELIEHLSDVSAFLANAKRDLAPGTLFVLTTPNACSWHNVLLGMLGRESMHPDHVAIHSYKTLNTLFKHAEFAEWELTPYHVNFDEMVSVSQGAKKLLAQSMEKLVRLLERLFPMLSCGWVCKIKV